MNLTRIINFLIRNKKGVFFVFFMLFMTSSNYAFAADSGGSSLIDIINMILKIAGTVLALLTELVSWFMSPAWTSGRAIGIESNLHELWLIVSNIVYLIFATILVIIAVMNIIGKTGEWEMRQALPKFLAGLLIVPFSWFIVGAIVGFSSVLSAALLGLPMDKFPSLYDDGLKKIPACKHYVFNIGKSKGKKKQAIECKEKSTLSKIVQGDRGVFHIMSIYTYGVMRLDSNGKLNAGDIKDGNIKSLASLGVKGLFDVIFIIVYFLLMVAIGLALFVRGIVLWLFMVVSPFFGVLYFLGNKGGAEKVAGQISFKRFLDLAMMPVYVSGALAFGLLFILVAGKGMNDGCKSKSTVCIKSEKSSSTIEYLGIKLEFNGSFGASGEKAKKLLGGFKGAFGALVLQIFGIMILWITVMAALKTSDITQGVIQPIEQFGQSVGGIIKKAPTYLPIIPSPGGGMMSPAALSAMGGNIASGIDQMMKKPGSDYASSLFNKDGVDKDLMSFKNNGVDDYSKHSGLSRDMLKKDIVPWAVKLWKARGNSTEFDKIIKALKDKGVLKADAKIDKTSTSALAKSFNDGLKQEIKSLAGGSGQVLGTNNLYKELEKNSSSPSDSKKDTTANAKASEKTPIAEIKNIGKLGEEIGKAINANGTDANKIVEILKAAKKGGELSEDDVVKAFVSHTNKKSILGNDGEIKIGNDSYKINEFKKFIKDVYNEG